MRYSERMRGYSLVELIVSVAIFALVMLSVTSAYMTLIAVDREVRVTNQTAANLAFAVDSMARTIRTGKDYECVSTGGDGSGCTSFSFTEGINNQTVTYILITTGGKSQIGECDNIPAASCTSSNATAITDPGITIKSLKFYVRGTNTYASGDKQEPQVIFTINGSISTGSKSNGSDFTIETTASQRFIDL